MSERLKMLGKKVHYFSTVDSTNDIAFSLAQEGAAEGVLVIAEKQLKGQGSRGRKWFSPPGGLWFSLVLRPSISSIENARIYPLIGALAVVEAVCEMLPDCPAYFCWPNDAAIKGKKIAGAMCKVKLNGGKPDFVILGIGVNLNIESFPSFLKGTATSIFLETRRKISPASFLNCLLEKLEEIYLFPKNSGLVIKQKIEEFFPFLGKPIRFVTFEKEITGCIQGIDERGNLVVETQTGSKEILTPEQTYLIDSLMRENEFSD